MLVASVRHEGRSLAEIARTEISPFAGLVAMIAVLFILLVTLAGLGIVVVNALATSPWGVFTIGHDHSDRADHGLSGCSRAMAEKSPSPVLAFSAW